MLNNYRYFIALVEEGNISKAAARLYISHQCLSKYLKNLESVYRTSFFARTPALELTQAGEAYYKMLKQIQIMEDDLEGTLDEIRMEKRGVIRFGTTEGRYRVLIPTLITKFKVKYPGVTLETYSAQTDELCNSVLNNNLEIALMNQSAKTDNRLDIRTVMTEEMFLVISDAMLKQYFPDDYPACIDKFRLGADLKDFEHVPFVMGPKSLNARKVMDSYLYRNGIDLELATEISQSDLQYMLAGHGFGACFCWSMYIPSIHRLNVNQSYAHLYIFPIKGQKIENKLLMVTRKGKIFKKYEKDLMHYIKEICLYMDDDYRG